MIFYLSRYHPIQKALAGFYGTQCGYCSPGMVMTMHGELQQKGALTAQQVEDALDGNICRCTGYRPILDAFKSLSLDATPKQKAFLADIEEAHNNRCPRTGERCAGKLSDGSCRGSADGERDTCVGSTSDDDSTSSFDDIVISSADSGDNLPDDGSSPSISSSLSNIISYLFVTDAAADTGPTVTTSKGRWFYPVTGARVMNALQTATAQDKYLLVAGNTGSGVYKNDGPYTMFISLEKVPEMQQTSINSWPIKFGARVTLAQCIDAFRKVAAGPSAVPGYAHLNEIADHWQVVANLAVRNNGSWAGNLMLKNRHNEFPSDIFLTLACCDATLLIGNAVTRRPEQVKVIELPSYDMNMKVIVGMSIPPQPTGIQIRTFKITSRAVNAHAYVNAALRLPLDTSYKVTAAPRILFGGLGKKFITAAKTEQYLVGKDLSDASVVQEAAGVLASEAEPEADPEQGSIPYRRSLVQTLFYKAIVSILMDDVSPRIRSAGDKIKRGVNSGQQEFDENSDIWPLGKAIPKLESLIQVAGEAEYGDDVAAMPGELQAQFVLARYANARIDAIDAAAALAMPGVVDFVTAVDIPGRNSFFYGPLSLFPNTDPLFATDRVIYHGQPVGLIVAEDRTTAHAAAKLVKVTYSDIKTPILTIQESIKQKRLKACIDKNGKTVDAVTEGDPNVEGLLHRATNKIKGAVEVNTQYHFAMELMFARVIPIEDGYDVVCATQAPTETQTVIADVLGIDANSVNISVRRLGGAFGCKITRCNLGACAAAVAAHKTRRPVRLFQDLSTTMAACGWREFYYATYDVGFDNTGKFEAVNVNLYSGSGHSANESSLESATEIIANAYQSPTWNVVPKNALTDTSANTWCRTPGHVAGHAVIETIVDHVAVHLNKDPLEVREVNLTPTVQPNNQANVFKDSILPLLKEKAMIAQRKQEVEQFNKENRWRKRGLSVIPMKYDYTYSPLFRYTALVSIYAHDGTVAITHGGIEMGQGINTKVAQVAAATLGISLDLIKIKPTTTTSNANTALTGGSYGTDTVCHAIKICCERLRKRIRAFSSTLDQQLLPWPLLVRLCFLKDIDLCERYWTFSKQLPKSYIVWGGTCIEVEIDVLTGMYITRRADVIEDAGRSLSPYVDVGQVEGAFVMGLGLHTSEYLQFDAKTGEKLVTGTWEYKPPTALDIPADLRVTLLSNAPNPFGVLSSKATGEPPLCLAFGIVGALRQAIAAARADAGVMGWFHIRLGSMNTAVRGLSYLGSRLLNCDWCSPATLDDPPPSTPNTSDNLECVFACSPYGKVGKVLTFVSLLLLAWGALYFMAGDVAAAGGNLFSLLVVYVASVIGGKLSQACGLPPLPGMMLSGVALRNLPGIQIIGEAIDLSWSRAIRGIAVVVIILRGGLILDPKVLKTMPFVIFRLSSVPCIVETVVVAVVSHFLLGFPWLWSFMLGFILTAVTPPIIVQCLLQLSLQGYGTL
ncbi:xanthine dehydrogenase 2 [Hyalella azteca]|uniref:Xanthine dehydrogenase 2 n=1 Tax=Hyalella azteca TaxID=294128 RepID=A0A8B7NVR8_HYAAZ|nr:xanthine dehydrogenase 2 [Hyalella azteca]